MAGMTVSYGCRDQKCFQIVPNNQSYMRMYAVLEIEEQERRRSSKKSGMIYLLFM